MSFNRFYPPRGGFRGGYGGGGARGLMSFPQQGFPPQHGMPRPRFAGPPGGGGGFRGNQRGGLFGRGGGRGGGTNGRGGGGGLFGKSSEDDKPEIKEEKVEVKEEKTDKKAAVKEEKKTDVKASAAIKKEPVTPEKKPAGGDKKTTPSGDKKYSPGMKRPYPEETKKPGTGLFAKSDGDSSTTTSSTEKSDPSIQLDVYNSDLNLQIENDGLTAQALVKPLGFCFCWAGARANYGVMRGRVCFEVTITKHLHVDFGPGHKEDHPHVLRVGWALDNHAFQLGEDDNSYGYGGTGKFSSNCKFKNYGETFGEADVILAMLDFEARPPTISYSKNGKWLGIAESLRKHPAGQRKHALFPAILCKNVKVNVNFGAKPPAFPPPPGYIFVDKVPALQRIQAKVPPKTFKECEMLMMVGLPGTGKTTWAVKQQVLKPDKRYYVIGTDSLIDKMKVMGLPRKNNFGGRWDTLIRKATDCLNHMFKIGSKCKRSYILDQTNVYPSARRRKMKDFVTFSCKCAVLVPTDEVMKQRSEKRTREEGKEVPAAAVTEMMVNFKLPSTSDPEIDEIFWIELDEAAAAPLVAEYNNVRNRGRNGSGEDRPSIGAKPWEQKKSWESSESQVQGSGTKPWERKTPGDSSGRKSLEQRPERSSSNERKPWERNHQETSRGGKPWERNQESGGPAKPYDRREKEDERESGGRHGAPGSRPWERQGQKPWEQEQLKPWEQKEREGRDQRDGGKPWEQNRKWESREGGRPGEPGGRPWTGRGQQDEEERGGREERGRPGWAQRDERMDKPWERAQEEEEGHGTRKPWQQRGAPREEETRKPWQQQHGDERKPWQQRGGDQRKSWEQGHEEGRKPWQQARDDERKPWQQGRDEERKPLQQGRDEERKPWQQGRDDERKPRQQGYDDEPRKLWQQGRDEEQKPWQQLEDSRKSWQQQDEQEGEAAVKKWQHPLLKQKPGMEPAWKQQESEERHPAFGGGHSGAEMRSREMGGNERGGSDSRQWGAREEAPTRWGAQKEPSPPPFKRPKVEADYIKQEYGGTDAGYNPRFPREQPAKLSAWGEPLIKEEPAEEDRYGQRARDAPYGQPQPRYGETPTAYGAQRGGPGAYDRTPEPAKEKSWGDRVDDSDPYGRNVGQGFGETDPYGRSSRREPEPAYGKFRDPAIKKEVDPYGRIPAEQQPRDPITHGDLGGGGKDPYGRPSETEPSRSRYGQSTQHRPDEGKQELRSRFDAPLAREPSAYSREGVNTKPEADPYGRYPAAGGGAHAYGQKVGQYGGGEQLMDVDDGGAQAAPWGGRGAANQDRGRQQQQQQRGWDQQQRTSEPQQQQVAAKQEASTPNEGWRWVTGRGWVWGTSSDQSADKSSTPGGDNAASKAPMAGGDRGAFPTSTQQSQQQQQQQRDDRQQAAAASSEQEEWARQWEEYHARQKAATGGQQAQKSAEASQQSQSQYSASQELYGRADPSGNKTAAAGGNKAMPWQQQQQQQQQGLSQQQPQAAGAPLVDALAGAAPLLWGATQQVPFGRGIALNPAAAAAVFSATQQHRMY